MTPIFNEDAEEQVLGALLTSPRAVMAAQDKGLRPDHFYRPAHEMICHAIFELDSTGGQADSITVGALLREKGKLDDAGGVVKLHTLTQTVSTVANAGHHAQVVIDVAAERTLQNAAVQIGALVEGAGSAEEKLAEAEAIIARATQVADVVEFGKIGDRTADAFAEVKEAFQTGRQRQGLKTSFTKLDDLTNGFFPGQLVIVAARPGMGKSTLAQNIAESTAQKGNHVAIFSLEMGAEEIGLRMVSSISRVPHDQLRTGKIDPTLWDRVESAYRELQGLPIYTVDSETVTMAELRARSRRLKRSEGLDLLIVDYIQLMLGSSASAENRNIEVSQISRGLKMLARELEIPVIALSQLNRGVEMRAEKRPMLADLRDSGAIEQDADVVVFIYRDDVYNPDSEAKGEAELIVAKQRSGSTGYVRLSFLGSRCKFSNIGKAPAEDGVALPF